MDDRTFVYRVKDWEKFQHYKKKNKNFNNEQPWFMFYGRKLLRDCDFMTLGIDTRDFLVMCWSIGSQDNGFLPEIKQIHFLLGSQRDRNNIIQNIKYLYENGWLEKVSIEIYNEIQDMQEIITHENQIERMKQLKSQENPMTDYKIFEKTGI